MQSSGLESSMTRKKELQPRHGGWLSGKDSACQCRSHKRWGFNPWVRKIPLGMADRSSILTWKIPCTEEPGGLQSMGSQRVGRNWANEHIHTQTSLDPFFKRVDRIESSKEPEPGPSTSGVSEAEVFPACPDCPSALHLLPPLHSPVSNSSCLFTDTSPCNAGCYIALFNVPYFSRYCTARFKMFSLWFVFAGFFMYYLCEKYYKSIPA